MDKSRFSLENDSRRYLIWTEPGTCYYPSNIRKRDACGRGSVCVWGGIFLGGRTDFHVFPRGTVNAVVYRDDIPDAYVRPHDGAIGDAFLLQDDNARSHRARIIDDYFQQETILRSVASSILGLESYQAPLGCFRETSKCSQSAPSDSCRACNCFARAMALASYGTDRPHN